MTLSRKSALVLITLILLIAAALRVLRLDALPPGLHYDEAADTIIAREIAEGRSAPIFVEAFTGKEVLFFYWAAGWMKLIGATSYAMRLAAAMMGVLTVAATYWAVREMFSTPVDQQPSTSTPRGIALLAATFIATSFWHVSMSRMGFRSIAEPCVQALALAMVWRGVRLNDRRWLLWGGACIGLNLYTYLAARLFPIAMAVLFIYLIASDVERRRERLLQFTLVTLAAIAVFAPLGIFFLQHPDAFLTRITQVAPRADQSGDLLMNIGRALGMFFIDGDPYARFNLPRRPLFPSLWGVLFMIGVVASIAGLLRLRRTPASRLRGAVYFFALSATAIMLLSTALALNEVTPSNLRGIGMIPLVFVFPALGAWLMLKALFSMFVTRRVEVGSWAAAMLLLILAGGTLESTQAYQQYVALPQLYYESDGDLVDIARMLNDREAQQTPVYVHALHYRHPTLAAVTKDFLALRSVTAPDVLVLPEGASTQVFAYLAPPDHKWLDRFVGDASIDVMDGPDGRTSYEVIHIDAQPAIDPQIELDVNFGNVIELAGADVESIPESGAAVDVSLYWRVLNPPDRGDYALFVELRDAWEFQWGQVNAFDYPSEQWTRGELIIQRIRAPIRAGAPPGEYRLDVGWYSASGDRRLPIVTAEGGFGGTAARVGPIAIARASQSPDVDALDIGARIDAPMIDGLALLGASIETPVAPQGAPMFFTLFWRADDVLDDAAVEVRLVPAESATGAVLYAGAPVHGTYPFDRWALGEVVADRYGLRAPVDAAVGDARLQVRVGASDWVEAAQVRIEASERRYDDQVELLGYAVDRSTLRAGESLHVTLYWRALRTLDRDYTVFTHLLDASGVQRGGRDHPPVAGTYPTSLWIEGEVVVDAYDIPLDADAPAGPYTLEIGLYRFESGERLPLSIGGDALRLLTVQVGP
jgi:4-amino-4-deoxy-L-arabinose transferase-like glycosyltransferase